MADLERVAVGKLQWRLEGPGTTASSVENLPMGEAFQLARRWRRDKLEAARAARANTARPSVVSWLPAPGAKGLQAPRPAAPSALVAVREASAATRLGEGAPQSALQALARARLAHPNHGEWLLGADARVVWRARGDGAGAGGAGCARGGCHC